MIATEWNFDSSPMRGDRHFHFRQCIGSQQNLSFRAFKLHIREKYLTQNSSITFFRIKKRDIKWTALLIIHAGNGHRRRNGSHTELKRNWS